MWWTVDGTERTGEGGAAALDRRGAYRCPPGTLAALDALHIPMEGSLKPSSCRPPPRSFCGLDGTGDGRLSTTILLSCHPPPV